MTKAELIAAIASANPDAQIYIDCEGEELAIQEALLDWTSNDGESRIIDPNIIVIKVSP
jgi:hypothetical protein